LNEGRTQSHSWGTQKHRGVLLPSTWILISSSSSTRKLKLSLQSLHNNDVIYVYKDFYQKWYMNFTLIIYIVPKLHFCEKNLIY
jgi:hypothetical protein